MRLWYKLRKCALLVVISVVMCGFSLSANARFGGGGSHSSFHSSSHSSYSHSYSRSGGSGGGGLGVVVALALLFGVFSLFAVGAIVTQRIENKEAQLPLGVDKEALVKLFKDHFMTLQVLWDEDDWVQIAKYVNHDMLNWLRSKRAATKATQAPKTVIKDLTVLIKAYAVENNLTTATVRFKGSDNEGQFTEDWSMMKDDKDWCLIKLTTC